MNRLALNAEVYNVSRRMRKFFNVRARVHGFTLGHSTIIGVLSYRPGMNQIELAEELQLAPIALSRILKKMEQDGHIERRVDPTDGRSLRLFLAPAAKPLLRILVTIGQQVQTAATKGFTKSEVDAALDLLRRMSANLNEERKGSADAPPALRGRPRAKTRIGAVARNRGHQ